MEETGVHGEKQQPVASHWQTLSHKVLSSTPRHERICLIKHRNFKTDTFIKYF